jgi:hypothetical protein
MAEKSTRCQMDTAGGGRQARGSRRPIPDARDDRRGQGSQGRGPEKRGETGAAVRPRKTLTGRGRADARAAPQRRRPFAGRYAKGAFRDRPRSVSRASRFSSPMSAPSCSIRARFCSNHSGAIAAVISGWPWMGALGSRPCPVTASALQGLHARRDDHRSETRRAWLPRRVAVHSQWPPAPRGTTRDRVCRDRRRRCRVRQDRAADPGASRQSRGSRPRNCQRFTFQSLRTIRLTNDILG